MHAETLVSGALAAEVMPTGQLVQDETPASEYLPAAQAVQPAEPPPVTVPE